MPRSRRQSSALVGSAVTVTSAVLAGIGALHAAWGFGFQVPGVDGDALLDSVVGSTRRPSRRDCFAVAGALGVAATLVAGRPKRPRRLRRLGQLGVAATLGGRAALGFAGRTDLVSPGSTSRRFRQWDRRVYSPLCAALAAGALTSLRRP